MLDNIFAPIKTKKTSTMKKVFAILVVAGLMTACNNAEKTEAVADSTKVAVDSAAKTVDSSMKANMDSTVKKVDTTKVK